MLAVGTRLQDFTTGSWSLFADDARFIGLNAARFDARKHQALPVVGDAQAGLEELGEALHGWQAPESGWPTRAAPMASGTRFVDQRSGPTNAELPTYAHVVGAVNRLADPRDLALTAAGGMPGELCMNWRAKATATFDCEFGFSCMGYEIAGGWGAKLADPSRDVIVMVGDGSYLLMNSDIYSSVLTGHEADRRGLRQWRLRRHRPAAAGQGHPVLQQPARPTPAMSASWCGSTSPSTPRRWGRSGSASRASASWRTRSAAPRRPTGPR